MIKSGKTGNDSILTVYLGVDLSPEYFGKIASEHVFYTPSRLGEHAAGPLPLTADRSTIEAWLADFFRLTTYEIAIPALRDESLAPPGQSGLIISMLFDYQLTKQIEVQGWYPDFKDLAEQLVIQTLSDSIYPDLDAHVIHPFSTSPLTTEHTTANIRWASPAGVHQRPHIGRALPAEDCQCHQGADSRHHPDKLEQ